MSSDSFPLRLYFNEFNVLMGKTAYLPLVSGLLCASASTRNAIRTSYEMAPFLFHRDKPENILAQYRSPAVAAFSVSMWNEQLSLTVARAVKERFPDCLIIFGGPQVPFAPHDYFANHPFIDVTVRGEGEQSFAEILERNLETRLFEGIAGIAWRDPNTGKCVVNHQERNLPQDLDSFPSPYLTGLYEYLFETQKEHGLTFQAIIETNRGCPFNCAYCFWGKGGLSTRYRFFPLERIKAELTWCARHEIRYVFNADSNFGIHKRDQEIAEFLVQLKERYGYPEKLRTCFGKNTDERIFRIGKLMHKHQLEKSVTLSRQSNSQEVLRNINRHNIKLSTFNTLQRRFNQERIPVYSELILGLPGETYESWITGIEEHLQSGLKNQLFMYLCEVYPNTKLADPAYAAKFGIQTRRIALTEVHGSPRHHGDVQEYQDIVIGTASMPTSDWRKAVVFSWMTMLLYSMKLGFFLLIYLADRYGIPYTDLIRFICDRSFDRRQAPLWDQELRSLAGQVDRLLAGGGRGHVLPEFGDIYWDEEEAAFLRISLQRNLFYEQFHFIIQDFLHRREIAFHEEELAEALTYQRLRIPTPALPEEKEKTFAFNFPEYFEFCCHPEPIPFKRQSQTLLLEGRDFQNDKERFAREVVLWGRKSGTILVEASWRQGGRE